MAELELRLANPQMSPKQATAEYYYKIPVRPIYKMYPVYPSTKEPAGYMDRLASLEPEVVFDPSKLKSERDWIEAGELVFDTPILFDSNISLVRDPKAYEAARIPLTTDGVNPFLRYVVRKKGQVEVGQFACGSCHTRVMPDGAVLKGAQGNFPFDRLGAYFIRQQTPGEQTDTFARNFYRFLFAAPWIEGDTERTRSMTAGEYARLQEAIPPGVLARHRSSLTSPVQVPDLIGIKDRKYLDRTGLQRHNSIVDLMRYAALNQLMDQFGTYGDFVPITALTGGATPPAETNERYSDEQLYALALYLYSLKPPPNPNRPTAETSRGETVFRREGCATCHTPPLYTNNKLTPAPGFTVPKDDLKNSDILQVVVGTDPELAIHTRRGTGYYKVPSLKGVWYRGPFEHNGSVATLEDWFDPRRLRPDYIPTGFRGAASKTRPIKGHEFGLTLVPSDKMALIAFLRTL
jgi:hypothetical protein